jgi:Uma2 family endonuclease
MAIAALKTYISEDEYVSLEDNAEEKHEYLDGYIYGMAGSSPEHSLLSSNVIQTVGPLARPKGCRVFTSDLRVRVSSTGLYTYPDATIVCGALITTNHRPPAAVNPSMIVEVLSESTHDYDRGEKWLHYQTIESLSDYLLIWQDRPIVEHYARLSDESWTYRMVEGLERSVPVETLGGALLLADIYRDIVFPEQPYSGRTPPPDELSE